MSGPPLVIRLLAEQRKRCLATIYGAAETSPWWNDLTKSQQVAFREQIRSAVSVFYDVCRDVVKVTEDDTIRNDVVVDLIRSLHSQQQRIVNRLDASA